MFKNSVGIFIFLWRNFFFSNFQLILAACSQFFSKLFHENAQFGPNSLIVLPKDIRPQDFAHLLQYMYQGQVEVPREDLDHVLKVVMKSGSKSRVGHFSGSGRVHQVTIFGFLSGKYPQHYV